MRELRISHRRRATLAAFFAFTMVTTLFTSIVASRAGESLVEQLEVDTRESAPRSSSTVLQAGKTYRIEVSGAYNYQILNPAGGPFYLADAECTTAGPPQTPEGKWRTHRYDPVTSKDDSLDLYVNGGKMDWLPVKGTEYGNKNPAGDALCSTTNTYNVTSFPGTGAKATFHIHSLSYTQHAGRMTIRIYMIGGEVQVAAATVDSASRTGSLAQALSGPSGSYTFTAGNSYRIEASGTYFFTVGTTYRGDAECSGNGHWEQNQYGIMTPLDPTDDPLDLTIDGRVVDWVPLTDDGKGCNLVDHVYSFVYVAQATKTIRFAISDFDYSDNSGTLSVAVFLLPVSSAQSAVGAPDVRARAEETIDAAESSAPHVATQPDQRALTQTQTQETPILTTTVDSSDGEGTLVEGLQAGRSYRVEASGTYLYTTTVPDASADAECSRDASDATYKTDRYNLVTIAEYDDDPLDLSIDGRQPAWTPTIDNGEGCNVEDHTYTTTFVASADSARFAIYEFCCQNWGDNVGTLTIRLFRIDEALVETVLVDTSSQSGTTSSTFLEPGSSYRLLVAGTFLTTTTQTGQSWSTEADAECTRTTGDKVWQADRYGFYGGGHDWLDLYVDRSPVTWRPTKGSGACNEVDHTYDLALPPVAEERQVHFAVTDFSHLDNAGVLAVRILKILD